MATKKKAPTEAEAKTEEQKAPDAEETASSSAKGDDSKDPEPTANSKDEPVKDDSKAPEPAADEQPAQEVVTVSVNKDWPYKTIQSAGVTFVKDEPAKFAATDPNVGEWEGNPYLDVKRG